MSLMLEDVAHIADLAKLGLTAAEMERFREQLSAVLDHVAMLQRLDTSAVPPTSTVLPLRNVMRDDEVRPSLPREDVLSNAPDTSDAQFRVRAILG